MKRIVLALAVMALLGGVVPVQASPIAYTFTATGSGSLDGLLFSNSLVTITLLSDTSTVFMPDSGDLKGLLVNRGTATVSVAGSKRTDTFLGPMAIVLAPSVPGFGKRAGAGAVLLNEKIGIGILGTISDDFLKYDLTSSFGPILGDAVASLADEKSGEGIHPTTAGDFHWTVDPKESTFTATATPTPEPASLLLLGTAVVTLAGRRLTRRR